MKLKRLSLFLALVMILSAFAGTFTIASAATAGGTFEIWRDGAKVESYTGTIAAAVKAGKIADGDTVKLTSDYVSMAVDESITMNLTIDGQGHTIANNVSGSSGRLFNIGGPGTNSTGVITVTFKNVTMIGRDSLVQVNSVQGTVIFDNCDLIPLGASNILVMTKTDSTITLQNGSTLYAAGFNQYKKSDNSQSDSLSIFYMGAERDTVNIVDSTVTVAGAPFAVINTKNNNQTVNFDGATMIAKDFAGRDSWTHGFVNTDDKTGIVINVKGGSIFDSSLTYYHRLMYIRAGVTLNLEDCAFFGAAGSHDIMQVQVKTKVNIGNNVVFAGGGSKTAGDKGQIIRNYSTDGATATPICYSSSDPYHQIKVMNRDATEYATDDALLAAYGIVNSTPVNGNYDAVAEAMGYGVRITASAEEAYDNGKFTGYYHSVNDAITYSGKTILGAGKTVYVIGDCGFGELAFNLTNAEDTFVIEGVKKANGEYPTVTVGSIFSFSYGQNLGASIIRNLNVVAGGANITQINTGLVVFENCNITQKTHTYGFIIQGKDANTANTEANTAAGAILYYGRVALKNTTLTVPTGGVHVFRFNSAYGEAIVENSTIIHKGTGSPIHMNASGMLNIDANSKFVINAATPIYGISDSKVLTLNGTEIKTAVTAGAMLTGASVRIARGNELAQSGIRFESALTAAQVAAAEATGATVSYGTVVFKKADLGNMTVAELVAAANADANDALIVAEIKAKDGIVTDAEGNKTIRAAIINIKEQNYGVEFGAVAYIELTYENGSTVRIYGAFNATNNVRSIKGVAEAALEDYETEAGVVNGYNYYNEITVEIEGVETTVYSCYSDEQIAILNTYAGK